MGVDLSRTFHRRAGCNDAEETAFDSLLEPFVPVERHEDGPQNTEAATKGWSGFRTGGRAEEDHGGHQRRYKLVVQQGSG